MVYYDKDLYSQIETNFSEFESIKKGRKKPKKDWNDWEKLFEGIERENFVLMMSEVCLTKFIFFFS